MLRLDALAPLVRGRGAYELLQITRLDGYEVLAMQQSWGLFNPSRRRPASAWAVDRLRSTDTAATLSARLATMGLVVDAGRIVLAGEQTVYRLAHGRAGARVAIYAEDPLVSVAARLGLRVGAEEPDLVLIARDTDFSLSDLSQVLEHLDRGAELVVTNVDLSHPGPKGEPVAETGAILAVLTACRPDTVYACIGKPDPALLEIALRKAGADRTRTVFVGDNYETDGLAAEAAGLRFVGVAAPVAGSASVVGRRNRLGAIAATGS